MLSYFCANIYEIYAFIIIYNNQVKYIENLNNGSIININYNHYIGLFYKYITWFISILHYLNIEIEIQYNLKVIRKHSIILLTIFNLITTTTTTNICLAIKSCKLFKTKIFVCISNIIFTWCFGKQVLLAAFQFTPS